MPANFTKGGHLWFTHGENVTGSIISYILNVLIANIRVPTILYVFTQ